MDDISEIQVNPSPDAVIALTEGSALNQEALKLSDQGDLEGAARLHLRAIELKERGLGPDSITLALSKNALGELYMRMNKYAEAEVLLKAAIDVREHSGPPFDAAVSRDNLAALYEAQGKMAEAREMRIRGAPDSISCSNHKCPGYLFALKDLLKCGRCKAALYCSKSCQKIDWSRHKKCCKG